MLGVNDSLHDFTSMITLSLKNSADNVHDLRSQSRESHENSIHDAGTELLELGIHILQEFDSGFSELLKLGLNEIVENIDRWESWN